LRAAVLSSSEGSVAGRPEYIIAEIDPSDSAKLLIAVVYRPPKAGHIAEFFQRFSDYQTNYRHSIIFGDFNADLNQNTFDSQQIQNSVNTLGMYLVPYKSTHHLRHSSTLLDLSIIDDRDKLMDYGQQDVAFLSAHDLIHIKYRIKIQRTCGRRIMYRDWSRLDKDALISDICGIDWTALLASNNMDEKVEEFNTKLTEILNKQIPLRTRCFKNLPAPWLTEEIKQEMRSRDQARRTWRRYRCDRLYKRYKTLRNNVQTIVRAAKKEHYTKMFSRAGKAEEIWRGLRHLGLIKARAVGGRLRHTVEELSDFFAQSDEQWERSDENVLVEVCSGVFNEDNFHWKYVGPESITKAIAKMKSNAVGADGIPLSLLKCSITYLTPIIEHLFNYSLMNGVFPSNWKIAVVCPIPKIKSPVTVKDYRPISILPVLAKALER
ncbi:PREDICTED: uncharacterized protein LOC105556295, partial [Vollenhovia emeryi]|uniref:uncharacterized protein LOC105556295 n=1 Tax=Vollenhovia emeryi TaxID=411798 RepID=UPI0005F53F18